MLTSKDLIINDVISVKGRDSTIEIEIVNISITDIEYKYVGINNIITKRLQEFDNMFEIVNKVKEGDGKFKGRTKRTKTNGNRKSYKQK